MLDNPKKNTYTRSCVQEGDMELLRNMAKRYAMQENMDKADTINAYLDTCIKY